MAAAILTLVGTVLGALIVACTERYHAKNQLRLAAIEKRLNAHQMAYELCYRMRSVMHRNADDKNKQILGRDYEEWWLKNCIFLGPRSRRAIDELFQKWSLYDPTKKSNPEMSDLTRHFESAFRTLLAEVGLPSVTHDDSGQR